MAIGTASAAHSGGGVSILKCGGPRPPHEFARSKRLVFAKITIQLPASQAAAGIHNFPTRAAENSLDFISRGFQNDSTPERSRRFRRSGKSRDQRTTASAGAGRVGVGLATHVLNIIAPIHRHADSPVAFLFYRPQKIAGIAAPVQSRFRHAGCVKTALEREAAFLWRVIKSADNEILTRMTDRPLRKSLILVGESLNNFRPRDVRRGG